VLPDLGSFNFILAVFLHYLKVDIIGFVNILSFAEMTKFKLNINISSFSYSKIINKLGTTKI